MRLILKNHNNKKFKTSKKKEKETLKWNLDVERGKKKNKVYIVFSQ